MKLIACLVLLLTLACPLASFADDTLTKEEVLALVSGSSYKSVSAESTNFGEIRADGSAFATNSNGSSKGTWRVTDDGQYCIQWDNSRWTGNCSHFSRTDKPNVYSRKAPRGGEQTYAFDTK